MLAGYMLPGCCWPLYVINGFFLSLVLVPGYVPLIPCRAGFSACGQLTQKDFTVNFKVIHVCCPEREREEREEERERRVTNFFLDMKWSINT